MNIREERWGVIVNPYAGTRDLRKDWIKIYRLLKKAEIQFTAQTTEYAGHAIDLARNYVENGIRHLLVVGGDGTVNEVVNGIYTSNIDDKNSVCLALIPYGTGNDWARYWGLLNIHNKLSSRLYNRRCVKCDIGCIEFTSDGNLMKKYFINAAGFGLDGLVVKHTDYLKRVFGGSAWVYSLSVLLAVFTYKSTKMKITVDEGVFDKNIFTIALGNSCYSGGGLKQVPAADPTDGLFHITAIEKPTFWKTILGLKAMFAGKIDSHPCASTYATTTFILETDASIYAETDGILIDGDGKYKISNIHLALNMIV